MQLLDFRQLFRYLWIRFYFLWIHFRDSFLFDPQITAWNSLITGYGQYSSDVIVIHVPVIKFLFVEIFNTFVGHPYKQLSIFGNI